MSDIKLQNVTEAQKVSANPEMLAMVYKNEHNEVSYYASASTTANELDNGLSSIVLVFVLSFVALVTISRRNSGL